MTHGAHAAIIAAEQERKRKLQQEEEEMTTYSTEDLNNNWEFKIVRARARAFRNPDIFAALLEEESMAGWKLVEKLDDQRIRFKRNSNARRNDEGLPPGFDPYRTQYGTTSNTAVVAMILGLVIALGLGGAVIFMMELDTPNIPIWSMAIIIIPVIMVVVGIIAVVASRNRQ